MRIQILIFGFKVLIGTSEIKRKSKREEKVRGLSLLLACSRRSDSGERCEVKRSAKKLKAREEELPSPPLLFIAFFTSAPLSTI